MGAPLVIIHFRLGFSPTKTNQLLGDPHDYGNPRPWTWPIIPVSRFPRLTRDLTQATKRDVVGLQSWWDTVCTGYGPPDISWFINHEVTPINYSYIP